MLLKTRVNLFVTLSLPLIKSNTLTKLCLWNAALDEAICHAKSETLIIPFGVGIGEKQGDMWRKVWLNQNQFSAGHVAKTKEIVNIRDAYKDPRFNRDFDEKTGYKTNIILSMPICNYEGEVIGVAQIINKTNGATLSKCRLSSIE